MPTPVSPASGAPLPQRLATEESAHLWSQNLWWETCPDLLGLIRLDGYFVRANPAWHTVLGWLPEEVVRLPFKEFIHPEDLLKTQQAWERGLAGGVIMRFENRYLCQDGRYKALNWLAVVDGDHMFCQARDVEAEVAYWTQHEQARHTPHAG